MQPEKKTKNEDVKTADGTPVTDEMIDDWCEALDGDEWPKGWQNVGEVASSPLGEDDNGS